MNNFLNFAKEYIEQDANQTVILYRVDLEKTKVNDIYKEASKDAIRFLPPIELPVGIITSLLGSPFFISLIFSRQKDL